MDARIRWFFPLARVPLLLGFAPNRPADEPPGQVETAGPVL
ncbi:hypothetical protein [Candidatus Rariloculus sp.]